MTYGDLLRALFYAGYQRVERDDRLLDVFPDQDREKGIELWERWMTDEVRILRVRVPFVEKKLELFSLKRKDLEKLLSENTVEQLDSYTSIAKGGAVEEKL